MGRAADQNAPGTDVHHCGFPYGRRQLIHRLEELRHEVRLRFFIDLPGRTNLQHPAVVHNRNAIGDRERLLPIMGRQTGDGPLRTNERLHIPEQPKAWRAVQIVQGLIAENNLGQAGQNACRSDPLSLPSGKLVGISLGEALQRGRLHELVDPPSTLAPAHVAESKGNILTHRLVWKVRMLLKHDSRGSLVRRDDEAVPRYATISDRHSAAVRCLDAGLTEGVYLNVTSDNEDLGRKAAESLAEAINEEGDIVLFTRDLHPGVRAQAKGARAAFEQYRDIEIIREIHIEAPGPVDFARSATEDLLTSYSEPGSVAGIWTGWDEPAYGATQAFDRAGRGESRVVGVDGTDFAVEEIDSGEVFAATVVQDFDAMARRLVDLKDRWFYGAVAGYVAAPI